MLWVMVDIMQSLLKSLPNSNSELLSLALTPTIDGRTKQFAMDTWGSVALSNDDPSMAQIQTFQSLVCYGLHNSWFIRIHWVPLFMQVQAASAKLKVVTHKSFDLIWLALVVLHCENAASINCGLRHHEHVQQSSLPQTRRKSRGWKMKMMSGSLHL
jgi:hypothetical protein